MLQDFQQRVVDEKAELDAKCQGRADALRIAEWLTFFEEYNLS
jgi:hypothetical protein